MTLSTEQMKGLSRQCRVLARFLADWQNEDFVPYDPCGDNESGLSWRQRLRRAVWYLFSPRSKPPRFAIRSEQMTEIVSALLSSGNIFESMARDNEHVAVNGRVS